VLNGIKCNFFQSYGGKKYPQCKLLVSLFSRVQRQAEVTEGQKIWRHPAKKCLKILNLTHIKTSWLGGRYKWDL